MTQRLLLCIDVQNDFCDPKGSLFVPDAPAAVERLASFLEQRGSDIGGIAVTMDAHMPLHIAHALFWADPDGQPPDPFTRIRTDEVESGRWRPKLPHLAHRARSYVRALEAKGRFQLTIWPPHCLIGTWGHSLVPTFSTALIGWQRNRLESVLYVLKGTNPLSEHYSAVQAEVPDPADPNTGPNRPLLELVESAREILVAGQALSHCVANTVQDLMAHLGPESGSRFVLLRDTTEPVPGFEAEADAFLERFTRSGGRIEHSAAWHP